MSWRYALPLFLITSIIVIPQLWFHSSSWINGISDVSEIAILFLMGLVLQLSGRLISKIEKDEIATKSEE